MNGLGAAAEAAADLSAFSLVISMTRAGFNGSAMAVVPATTSKMAAIDQRVGIEQRSGTTFPQSDVRQHNLVRSSYVPAKLPESVRLGGRFSSPRNSAQRFA